MPDDLDTATLKMLKLQEIGAAILRAQEDVNTGGGQKAALNLQNLHKQRDNLRGTLPPLRAV